MSTDSGGTGNVMIAFVVGALTGAAIALLLAPASGDDTREFLAQKAREGKDKARQAMEESREFYARQRETVSTAVDREREAFQQARERGDQA